MSIPAGQVLDKDETKTNDEGRERGSLIQTINPSFKTLLGIPKRCRTGKETFIRKIVSERVY